MLEIEIKAPLPDRKEVESRLASLGAKKLGRKRQRDVYFAHPCVDFGETDQALRLRDDGGVQVLTYKGPKKDGRSKTREEIEIAVPMEEMSAILFRLGFHEFMCIEKRRTEYQLGEVVVCFDEVHGLEDYLELEYHGKDEEEGLRTLRSLMADLGVEGNETRSYLELLLEKGK